jgi:hypothetical protein
MPSRTSSHPELNNRSTKSHHTSLILVIFWLIVTVLLLINKQYILDWWKLRGYSPPPAISKLASEDGMTNYAYKVFKVNHPQIETSSSFDINCPNDGGEKTIVLGCYHSNQAGIYLLNVTDSRLDGVEQVTAAHEMLHAAYGRLSSSERNKVNSMLLDYYNHDLRDQRIISTIAEYRKTEPGQVVNEMHSVFGTEIANLPKPLQQYYSRYFNDRQKIADYAEQYESAFTSRENAVNQDDSQLATIKTQINSLEANLKIKLSSIDSLQSNLDEDKSSGSTSAYNAGVANFNSQVDDYNSEIGEIKGVIDSYNDLVNQRNKVALTENQLYQELSGANQSTIDH